MKYSQHWRTERRIEREEYISSSKLIISPLNALKLYYVKNRLRDKITASIEVT